jgi:hypothetical protein
VVLELLTVVVVVEQDLEVLLELELRVDQASS